MARSTELDLRTPGQEAIRRVEKPWGEEIWWAVTDRYAGKALVVRAGHQLSLQYHERKLESMFFVEGTGRVMLGDEVIEASPGLAITIRPGTLHRITAESDLMIIEVSTTELDDVVRVEDRYGRTQEGS